MNKYNCMPIFMVTVTVNGSLEVTHHHSPFVDVFASFRLRAELVACITGATHFVSIFEWLFKKLLMRNMVRIVFRKLQVGPALQCLH